MTGGTEPWQMAALDKRDVWLGCAGAPEVMGWSPCRSRKFLSLELGKEQANTSKGKDGFRWLRLGFFSSNRTR